jgi:hypothetical protein
MKTYRLMPPDPDEPDALELTMEEKLKLVADLRCLDENEVFEALTNAWRTEDLMELVKLLNAHLREQGDGTA